MTQLIDIRKYQEEINGIKIVIDNFYQTFKNDTFRQLKDETDERAFKRGQGILDRFEENILNLDNILEKEKSILEFFEICKENKQRLMTHTNELINQLLRIKKRKATKDDYLKTRAEMNTMRHETPEMRNRRETEEMLEEINDRAEEVSRLMEELRIEREEAKKEKEQLNDLRIETLGKEFKELATKLEFEMKKIDERALSNKNMEEIVEKYFKLNEKSELYNMDLHQVKKLEEMVGMETKEILFDSNIHKWNISDSDFGSNIKGHRHVCVVIEDTKQNIFGGYCSKQIGIDRYHYDEKGYLFSLMRNGKLTGKKYPLKENEYDFFPSFDDYTILGGFGAEYENGEHHFKDILLQKKEMKERNFCRQHSYEYYGEENALCGEEYFDVKRIVVFEMKETEEMRKEREELEKQISEEEQERWGKDIQYINKGFKKLIRMDIESTIFDSEIHTWSKNDSVFHQCIKGRKNLAIVVEDEKQNLFGGYIGDEVQINENVRTQNCFVFSIRKNGSYRLQRYHINPGEISYFVGPSGWNGLFGFGLGNDQTFKDIFVRKKDSSRGYCHQHAYDYRGKHDALCGKHSFNVRRVVVYQLKNI